MVYNVGDMTTAAPEMAGAQYAAPNGDGKVTVPLERIVGKAKEFPFLNCTSYSYSNAKAGAAAAGFVAGDTNNIWNAETDVPYMQVFCGAIIIPPSRRHELFFRMVCEWTLEFTAIRPLSEIMNWTSLGQQGDKTHYQNYSYERTKKALTGTSDTDLSADTCMVSSNVDVEKVM